MTRTLLASLVLIGFTATVSEADVFGNLGRKAKSAGRSVSRSAKSAGNSFKRSVNKGQKAVKSVSRSANRTAKGTKSEFQKSFKGVSNQAGRSFQKATKSVNRNFRRAVTPAKKSLPTNVKGISRDIGRVVKAIGKHPGFKLPKPGFHPLPKPIVKPLPHPIIPPNPIIYPKPGPHPCPTPIIPPNPIICPLPFPQPCPKPIVCPLPFPRPCPTPIICPRPFPRPCPTPVVIPVACPIEQPVIVQPPVVEQPETTEPATTIYAGTTLEMAGENLGATAGSVLVQAGPLSLRAKIVSWLPNGIKFQAPQIDLAEAVQARLFILLADGREYQNLPILFAPAQESESGDKPQLPVVQVGTTMMLDGQFGATAGTVQLAMAGMTLPAKVVEWTASRATFTAPALDLAKGVEAQLIIKRANGEVASQTPVLLAPAQS